MHTDPLAPVGPSPVGWPHRRSDLTVQDFFMDIPLWNLLGDAARTRRAAALMNILDVNPEWCEASVAPLPAGRYVESPRLMDR